MPPAARDKSAGGGQDAPLVSVVIAAYNAAAYIAETIQSVLRQTHTALEIIVVDDGSTDETAAVVASMAAADARIQLIPQKNQGVAAARNRAIQAASGEFIAPLDADDLWSPTKIARQVERFHEAGPEAGMVYCWWAWIDTHGAVLDRSPRWREEGRTLDRLVEVNFTGSASVPLFRRSAVVKAGGYNAGLRAAGAQGCEDWDLAIKIAEHHTLAVVPAVLVGYRRHPNSMSSQCETMWRSQNQVMSALASRQPELPPQVIAHSTGQFALHLAGVAFWSGDYAQACVWGLRANPFALSIAVLPHVMRLLWRRLLRQAKPSTTWAAAGVDEAALPEPLIPYDAIYARHWATPAVERRHDARVWQTIGVLLATVWIASLHWDNDGLWFQGDAPRHAANGLLIWDWLRSLPANPFAFALSYYARYPVIAPIAYPPLFYVLEALSFGIFGPSPFVGKVLVLLFAVMLGLYAMHWGRRWIAPLAGWAGVAVVLIPGIVRYSNAVLLNVPATAIAFASLYHLRRWLDGDGPRHGKFFAWLTVAAVLTYYPAALVLPIALLWAIALRGRRLSPALWLLPLIVLLLGLATTALLPVHFARHAPSLARLLRTSVWWFYADGVRQIVGWLWLVLGALGVLLGWSRRSQRGELALLLTATLVQVLCLITLPAMSDRYALLICPLIVLAGFATMAAATELIFEWRRLLEIGGVLAVLAISVRAAAITRVPNVTGLDTVAGFLEEQGASDSVLYSGAHDGVFVFYVRKGDPDFERRVVLSNKLLYQWEQNERFFWEETPHISSPDDVAPLLQRECGCRWVAVEVERDDLLTMTERHLRQALKGPAFQLVRSFPVRARTVSSVEVYRFLLPPQPPGPVTLSFPSFSERVFTGIEPVAPRR